MNPTLRSEPVRWLYDLQHFGIKLGLDNIRALLDLLDTPQQHFKTILVGGTNGKGSVTATLSALCEAHGLKSGMFTSPHLVHPCERVRVGGKDLTPNELDSQIVAMRQRLEEAERTGLWEGHPSFFEVMTAIALQTFKESQVDVAILEVGLGGRLDATNAVQADLSTIVTVDYDHMKTLGPEIEKIAFEKAGIIKDQRPVITAVTRPAALAVIQQIAAERGAPLIHALHVTSAEKTEDGSYSIETPKCIYPNLQLSLPGDHQIENLRTALVVFEQLADLLELPVSPTAVNEAVKTVRWPGRLDWREGPPKTLLDAAHNAEGARILANYLASLHPQPKNGTWLFGAMKGKQFEALLEPLKPFIQHVVLTTPSVARSADPEELEQVTRKHFTSVQREDDPQKALDLAKNSVPQDGFLLVAGSLYLVGEILGIESELDAPGPISM